MKKNSKCLAGATDLRILIAGGFISIAAILCPSSFKGAQVEKGSAEVASIEPASPDQVSFANRVAYQYAIEEVYWRHRIWPKENGRPKPTLDEMMSAAQIQRKVEDYLRDSALLADYWQRPITSEQLQAEMERMASQTKQPEVLNELFAALNSDPGLIAECLARPVLVERLIRNFYAHDERFHGDLKRRAESELRAFQSVSEMRSTTGVYQEVEWIKSDNTQNRTTEASTTITLNVEEWRTKLEGLALQLDGPGAFERTNQSPNRKSPTESTDTGVLAWIESGVVGPLQEDDLHYHVTAVLEKGKDRLRLVTIRWPKEPFESWAATAENPTKEESVRSISSYTLPQRDGASTGCTDDSWTSTNHTSNARYNHTAVWTGSEMIVWGGGEHGAAGATGGKFNPSTDSWLPVSTNGAPKGREKHTAVWTGSEMIIWGGVGPGLENGARYNPITDNWLPTSPVGAPELRYNHTAVWTGNEMVVWGGLNGLNNFLKTGGRYDPSTDSWVATSTEGAPDARESHTTVWTGSEMIVWGGEANIGPINGGVNTGGKYNPSTDSWSTTTTSGAPAPRFNQTAVWTGGEMIVWGGAYVDGHYITLNTGGRYNPVTNSWAATSTGNAPGPRLYHTAVWTGSEMVVWGGRPDPFDSFTDTGGRYNPSADNWIATSTSGVPVPRAGHTAVWTGSDMIIFGGHDGLVVGLDTGGRYNPTTDNWIATSINSATDLREYHTAVWTGSEMIVWGGRFFDFNIFASLNTGGKYYPSTDSWIATTAAGAPSSRYGHTAIWNGQEMIAWGGYDDGNYLNSGGKYNPSTNNWVLTSTGGAPSPRDAHSAVWSGNEMIVWGGFGGSLGRLNTGGRYDPTNDSWVATGTIDAPAPREYQTAVWTGNEMIVWGGDSGGSFFNTGGRYNPSTDSWVATSLIDAPTPRYLHTAVWTGGEMVVWGGGFFGNGNLTTLGTGGRYDPSTDSWAATSMVNAPVPRDFHTAVWTGSDMIVWGGRSISGNSFTTLDTGGKYNLITDSWAATSTTGAPDARFLHTAIWTGNEMIVWGGALGIDSNEIVNTGGDYCAQIGQTPTPTPIPMATPTPPPTPAPSSTPIPGFPEVRAPIFTMDTEDGFTVSDQPVTTISVNPSLNLIGFQADLMFDSAIAAPSPAGAPVTAAGLTASGWTVVGNVLDTGPGTIKILRVSAFSNDTITPLNGGGALFLIHWKRVSSTSGDTTPLAWSAPPDDFQFIDFDLHPLSPVQHSGLITITSGGTTPTPTVSPSPTPTETPPPGATSSLANISTRLAVGTGDDALIGGFIISGAQPKRVIIRALGPSLPVPSPLADPILELHRSDGSVITNDNWRDSQEAEIIASGLAPSDDAESTIIATLPPGGHTAIIRGKNETTGVALVEVYDLDSNASIMANVSTRGFVQTGDNALIGGTIIRDGSYATILVRAIGPSLSNSGVPDTLANPVLDLYDENGVVLATNDNWRDTEQPKIQATGLAPTNDLESAILRNLPPGGYTAIVRGKNSRTGVALVELYSLP